MKVLLILDFPLQTPCLAKFLFSRYCPKCSWPIRSQNSLKCKIPKKLRGQIDFLFADKHQSFRQVGAITFDVRIQVCPKYPNLWYLCNVSRKREGINMIFLHKINIKVFYKLVVTFFLVIARYAWSNQNSKSVISFQYLKKEVRGKVDFLHAD